MPTSATGISISGRTAQPGSERSGRVPAFRNDRATPAHVAGRRRRRTTGVIRRHAGFSLLELLVVVVIIGLFAGAAVLSMGVVGNDRVIEREALRLSSLLDLLREEALMQSRDFGISFTEHGYRFYAYDYQQLEWALPVDDNLFVERELEDPLRLDLQIEDRDLVLEPDFVADDGLLDDGDDADEQEGPEPQVMVLSSGELTPFQASFFREFDGGRFTVTAEIDGTIEVTENGFDR